MITEQEWQQACKAAGIKCCVWKNTTYTPPAGDPAAVLKMLEWFRSSGKWPVLTVAEIPKAPASFPKWHLCIWDRWDDESPEAKILASADADTVAEVIVRTVLALPEDLE